MIENIKDFEALCIAKEQEEAGAAEALRVQTRRGCRYCINKLCLRHFVPCRTFAVSGDEGKKEKMER
jgi:hypothetical protein